MPGTIAFVGDNFPNIGLIIGENPALFSDLPERIRMLRMSWRTTNMEIIIVPNGNIISIYSSPMENRIVTRTHHFRIIP
jgi:hypothetical protein